MGTAAEATRAVKETRAAVAPTGAAAVTLAAAIPAANLAATPFTQQWLPGRTSTERARCILAAGSSPSGVPGSGGQQASGSNASGSSAGSAPGADLTPVINANGAAFVSGSTSVPLPGQPGYDAHTTGISAANAATPTGADGTQGVGWASGSSGISQSGAGSSSTANNADPSGPSRASGDGTHHGLSAGIIAAISVIVALLFLVLLVFCCRRRAVALRIRRRNKWFAAGSYNRGVGADDYRDGGSGTKSARSSFATNIDRGQILTPAPPLDLMPPANDMSQVWPSNLNGSITVVAVPPATRTVESAPSPTIRAAPDRTSLSSLSSSGSGHGSRPPSQTSQYQHLTLPAPQPRKGQRTGTTSLPPSQSVRSHPPRRSPSLDHRRMTRTARRTPSSDFTEIAAAAGRPPTASSESSAHFAPVEMIRRPFVPTMDDEMAVNPGENVRIIKRFDDGWAYAENANTGMQGLIPIDCLRPIEEDLPAFLAKKRLSSYVPGPANAHERRTTLMSQRTSVLSGTSPWTPARVYDDPCHDRHIVTPCLLFVAYRLCAMHDAVLREPTACPFCAIALPCAVPPSLHLSISLFVHIPNREPVSIAEASKLSVSHYYTYSTPPRWPSRLSLFRSGLDGQQAPPPPPSTHPANRLSHSTARLGFATATPRTRCNDVLLRAVSPLAYFSPRDRWARLIPFSRYYYSPVLAALALLTLSSSAAYDSFPISHNPFTRVALPTAHHPSTGLTSIRLLASCKRRLLLGSWDVGPTRTRTRRDLPLSPVLVVAVAVVPWRTFDADGVE
ncbi:hypothetical protein NUW54_g9859 [Trametes sanguinea]|uniref:Uncharacterized protein n=1 Tax=Trametes sanguinea TaxID=158606 RepID=A0ACC1P320_9APHY|nr:hypothetical protein NUW54_g9859 [Trametes sanguinea]